MQKIAALAEMEGSGKYIERVESKKKVELPKGTWLAKPQEDNTLHTNTVEIVDPQTGNIITLAEMTDEFWTRKGADNKTEFFSGNGKNKVILQFGDKVSAVRGGNLVVVQPFSEELP